MAFSLNDKRTPLEQFLQGESVTAYEFMGTKRTFRIRCR